MNIVDVIIILALIMGAILGFKNGVLKTTAYFIGTLVVLIISFLFKDIISEILYENLPFINFGGAIKGMQVINVIFYELIAFILLFSILTIFLRFLLVTTGLIEKILKMTIILAIPYKLLGIVIGLLQYYTYIFVILFILNLPVFNINLLEESKYASVILNNSPLISQVAKRSINVYNEVYNIAKTRNEKSNEELNRKSLEVMLDNKFITYNSAKKLIDMNKIDVDNKYFIEKYKEG